MRAFFPIDLVPVPDELDGITIELELASTAVVRGWMTRRFLRGAPTYWTWFGGEENRVASGRLPAGESDATSKKRARCVDAIAWRAA